MDRKLRRERAAAGVNVSAAASGWGRGSKVILVPLDDSIEAKAALPVARLISDLMGATIRVLHVSDEHRNRWELLHRLKLGRRQETAGLIIDQVSGVAAEEIVRSAVKQQVMLVVMTTRGQTAYEGRVLRPVPEHVVQKVTCPAILVRPEIGPRIARMKTLRHILLPLDGRPCMMEVVGPAVTIADKSRAEIDVLYVASLYEAAAEAGRFTIPRYVNQAQHEWPEWVKECLDRFSAYLGAPPSAPAQVLVRHGQPWDEILKVADERDIDLIAMEWHGRFDSGHAAVVRGVLAESPCPVMLLRSPGHEHQP